MWLLRLRGLEREAERQRDGESYKGFAGADSLDQTSSFRVKKAIAAAQVASKEAEASGDEDAIAAAVKALEDAEANQRALVPSTEPWNKSVRKSESCSELERGTSQCRSVSRGRTDGADTEAEWCSQTVLPLSVSLLSIR